MMKNIILSVWIFFNVFVMFITGGFYSVFFEYGSNYILGKWIAFLLIMGLGILVIHIISKRLEKRKMMAEKK